MLLAKIQAALWQVYTLSAEHLVLLVLVGYVALYSGYDKVSSSLSPSLIWKILSFKNVDFSLREINKVSFV